MCGGVIADNRYLSGHNFQQFEGARVVTRQGATTIRDGAFAVLFELSAGCPPEPPVYRIEASSVGDCDDSDLVYEATTATGYAELSIEGDAPGKRLTCAEFPPGFDLELDVTGECLPHCGSVRAAVFDEFGSALGASSTLFLDVFSPPAPTFSGQGFAGILEPGGRYLLRYYFNGECLPPNSRGWERPFTATSGLNRVELSLALPMSGLSCF